MVQKLSIKVHQSQHNPRNKIRIVQQTFQTVKINHLKHYNQKKGTLEFKKGTLQGILHKSILR